MNSKKIILFFRKTNPRLKRKARILMVEEESHVRKAFHLLNKNFLLTYLLTDFYPLISQTHRFFKFWGLFF